MIVILTMKQEPMARRHWCGNFLSQWHDSFAHLMCLLSFTAFKLNPNIAAIKGLNEVFFRNSVVQLLDPWIISESCVCDCLLFPIYILNHMCVQSVMCVWRLTYWQEPQDSKRKTLCTKGKNVWECAGVETREGKKNPLRTAAIIERRAGVSSSWMWH